MVTLRRCPPLITKQEVETQMHADKKGFTQIEAELTFAPVQPGGRASAAIRGAFLLIGVHLRFRFLGRPRAALDGLAA